MKKKWIILIVLCPLAAGGILFLHACRSTTPDATQAVSIEVDGAKNTYKVSDELYRSGQPDKDGFEDLENKGIKSVLNLREYHRNDKKARETKLHLMHYPVAAGQVGRQDLLNCLALIKTAPKPVVVHCWHGSDRTGIVCAAYSIVYLGKTVDQAVTELKDGPFGHHETIYPNLEELLRTIDWPQFKTDLDTLIREDSRFNQNPIKEANLDKVLNDPAYGKRNKSETK